MAKLCKRPAWWSLTTLMLVAVAACAPVEEDPDDVASDPMGSGPGNTGPGATPDVLKKLNPFVGKSTTKRLFP